MARSSVATEASRNPLSVADSAEAWAHRVIQGATLANKLLPGPCPAIRPAQDILCANEARTARQAFHPQADVCPSRPAPLRVAPRAPKTPRPGALVRPEARAQLLHTFAHHELQAAEIFCWAFLVFPEAPSAFRRGLLGIAQDELRHTGQYIAEIERLGSHFGEHPVRDWFWQRFAQVRTPLQFVSLMGIGFEGANLDHAELWAERLREAGDEQAAHCQRSIGREEEPHVAFAVQWFERWAGPLEFDAWRAQLPAPLTPTVLRGPQIERAARLRSGQSEPFLEELDAWDRPQPGS